MELYVVSHIFFGNVAGSWVFSQPEMLVPFVERVTAAASDVANPHNHYRVEQVMLDNDHYESDGDGCLIVGGNRGRLLRGFNLANEWVEDGYQELLASLQ